MHPLWFKATLRSQPFALRKGPSSPGSPAAAPGRGRAVGLARHADSPFSALISALRTGRLSAWSRADRMTAATRASAER